jgi:hypothetical protein
VRGFAVTLAIGIVTSMFTAIIGTRAVINLIYGGKRSRSCPSDTEASAMRLINTRNTIDFMGSALR